MLTRLKVSGFKSLIDVDVRFSAFTCIAGANGAGKSNLFDAIRFLSALADKSFIEAAMSIRNESGKHVDIQSLFHCANGQLANEMCFEADMLIPATGEDHLGQSAVATVTFLRYKLVFTYEDNKLRLKEETLSYIKKGDAGKNLLFPHSVKDWRDSVIVPGRRGNQLISTKGKTEKCAINLHQDKGVQGRPRTFLAEKLPRTVLSDVNAETPTALLARQAMRSWQLLQLEPAALRQADEFTAPNQLAMNGAYLAKTLYSLATIQNDADVTAQLYSQITNRLAELLDDVRAVQIDCDNKRELYTLQVAGKDNTFHSARALSDGTLRFLALAVLESGTAGGVLCFEEPENGIHPQRINAMLTLIQDIAVDVTEPVGIDNPLRQVIINTHSPSVVNEIPDDALLIASQKQRVDSRGRYDHTSFSCLSDTWRCKDDNTSLVSKGQLLAYLNPQGQQHLEEGHQSIPLRVKDRADLQAFLPGFE